MKAFLTGGTGFIGQPLTRSLVSRSWDVVALVRTPDSPQARALANMGAQCVMGDVTDRESMHSGMTGVDVLIHNAAWYELGIPASARKLMDAINITGTDNALGLALELGISRTVYVSSTIYYGDTGPEARDETYHRQKPYRIYYEQSKAKAHEVAQQYQKRGLPVILICPAHVMGPNDHSVFGYFLRMYLNRLMIPFGCGPDMMISPVHVNDAAEGIALAAEKGRIGQTYLLAGDSMSLREVFEVWMTKPGGFKIRFYIPRWLAILISAPLEPLQRMVGLPAFISRETVSGSRISLNFTSARAQRELGWTYRPAKEMWTDIVEQELKLLTSRKKRDLLSRLKPVETPE